MSNKHKLKQCIEELDDLLKEEVTSETSSFLKWKAKTKMILESIYGEESNPVVEFDKIKFSINVIWYSLNVSTEELYREKCKTCRKQLEKAKAILSAYVELLEDDGLDKHVGKESNFEEIFLVYGHDEGLKNSVARVIESQGITPIILDELCSSGSTIIEKIEEKSDVKAAVCLFTADDVCTDEKSNSEYRARQNVVFETGYFIGRIGRKNVIIIKGGDVSLPSDLQGVLYTESNDWKLKVLGELKSIGYDIDLNKIIL